MPRPSAPPPRDRPALRSSRRFHHRVLPAAGWRDAGVDVLRSPGAWLILVDGRASLQHGIDDSPSLFDVVLPREQGGVAVHGVAEHSLVSVHLVRARELSTHHLSGLADGLLPWRDDVRAHRDRDIRTDP